MPAVVLLIGGRRIAVKGDCAECFLRSYSGAQPFMVAAGESDWTVRYGVDLEPLSSRELLSKFLFSEINADCFFYRDGDDYWFEIRESAEGALLVAMRHRFGSSLVEATACGNDSALRFSLWFAFSMLAASVRVTFVHSSVIVHSGCAVLFLGESGTGKSTHTRLWLKNIPDAHLLNDDSPVLAVEDGKPYIYGSPWSGKTPCYVQRRFPLAAIVRLSQAKENRMRRLPIPGAFGALQPSLPPALMQDERFADMLIDIISDTISTAPAYHLECLPDADAAQLSCKTVFG